MVEHAVADEIDERSEEIDLTLIDWFLTLSPCERLQASANWARLAAIGRVQHQDD